MREIIAYSLTDQPAIAYCTRESMLVRNEIGHSFRGSFGKWKSANKIYSFYCSAYLSQYAFYLYNEKTITLKL